MFSKEDFILQYQNLSNPDKNISQQANTYILKLQQTQMAFIIAKELLDTPNVPQEYQFIACQLIYRRLREECDQTILPYLQQLLLRNLPQFALNQICSSFAVIIVGNQELWGSVLDSLIQLMKQQNTIKIGIDILGQIAIQSKEWYNKSHSLKLQEEFLQQEQKLSEIFTQLLSLQDEIILLQTINCIEAWIQIKYNFFKNQILIHQVINLLNQAIQNNAHNFIDKFFNVLTEAVIFSDYNRMPNALGIEQITLQNLQFILDQLLNMYNQQIGKGYAQFTTKFICDFSGIIFGSNYEQPVFALMLNIMSHPSRKIAFQTFQFWSEMKEKNLLQGFGLNILQTMIDKCRMKSIKLTKEFLQGEPEEEDQDYNKTYYEGGEQIISTADFREHAKEIFFCIYKSVEQTKQLDQYYSIVLNNLNISSFENKEQIIQSEAALFSLCSVIDEANIAQNNQQIYQIINFVLKQPFHQNNDILVKTALQMFSEFTNQFQLPNEIVIEISKYIFQYMLHQLLGPLAAVAFEQICSTTTINNTELIDQSLLFLEQNLFQFINANQVNNYIEGIIKVCQNYPNNMFLIKLFNLANLIFLKIGQSVNEKQFIYSNTVVTCILNWVNLNIEDINSDIKKLSDQLCYNILTPLIQLLQQQQHLAIYDEIFKLLRIIIKVANYDTQQNELQQLLTLAITIFSQDPISRSNWLQLVTFAISRTQNNQMIGQWLQNQAQNIDKFCIEQYNAWKDPDLMKVYVEYVKECLRFNKFIFFQSPFVGQILECICDSVAQLNSYEMQREIFHFFKVLVQELDITMEVFPKIVTRIITLIFSELSELNPVFIVYVIHILTILQHKKVNLIELEQLIYKLLCENWGKDKKPNQVQLVSKAIIVYLSKLEPNKISRELKLLLTNLRPMGEQEINYMSLEIAIRKG